MNPNFTFGSLGGRFILLAFLPPPGAERAAALQLVGGHGRLFEDEQLVFFGVLPDAASFAASRNEPPYRWFGDPGGELRRLYDAAGPQGEVLPQWILIDPMLRVLASAPLDQGPRFLAGLASLGAPDDHAGAPMHAPVLIVPRVFEPSFCQGLIDYYHRIGGEPSGVMRERDGKTVAVLDDFKRRRDVTIADDALIGRARQYIVSRLAPQIEKAFQFKATRMERYLVARYGAEEGGYFMPHRDNTTPGTAHRQFAVSINLNAEDFQGGDLRFPEFGSRTYRPPTGGAVVFSCSLLHEATPVTHGARFAFLPFLYDDDHARLREANLGSLAQDTAPA